MLFIEKLIVTWLAVGLVSLFVYIDCSNAWRGWELVLSRIAAILTLLSVAAVFFLSLYSTWFVW